MHWRVVNALNCFDFFSEVRFRNQGFPVPSSLMLLRLGEGRPASARGSPVEAWVSSGPP